MVARSAPEGRRRVAPDRDPPYRAPVTSDPARPPSDVALRTERPDDAPAVETVVAEAFGNAPHAAPPRTPGGPPGEVDLLRALRKDPGWLPDLSIVAVEEAATGTDEGVGWIGGSAVAGRVVGHVVCTRADVDGAPALGLGPVAVHPERQGRGIGDALVREVLARAEAAGETLVALLGDPAYYGRFGFVPARAVGVESPDPAWGDYFQALTLGGRAHPRGPFRYAPPFDAVS